MKSKKNKIKTVLYRELKKAYSEGEVPVACVIVDDEENIISYAHNKREAKQNSLCHAEVIAINKACKKLGTWRLENLTIYVSLEPCVMCTGAIIQSRIKHVVFNACDKRNGSIISNNNLLDDIYTHKVTFDYQEDEYCSNIISDFFKELRSKKGLK